MGIRQQNSGVVTNGATSFNATLPQAALNTSRVVVFVAGNTIVNTPAGFTSRDPQVNVMGHYLFDRAGDGGSSWAFTLSAGHVSWHAYEVEQGAYVVADGQNGGVPGSGAYTTPAVTPAAGETALIASLAWANDQVTARTVDTWLSSFAEQSETNSTGPGETVTHASAVRVVTADGTTAYSTGATVSGSGLIATSSFIAAYSTGTPTPVTLPFAAVTASGFAVTVAASAQAALADSDDGTYITSGTSPSSAPVDLTMTPIETPAGDLVVNVRAASVDAVSASIVATLRDGGTTVATAATVNPTGTAGNLAITFPAANISSVTQAKWRSGTLVVRLAVTAA